MLHQYLIQKSFDYYDVVSQKQDQYILVLFGGLYAFDVICYHGIAFAKWMAVKQKVDY